MDYEEQVTEIKKVIRKLRPYLMRDGGDLEYIDFVDGVVYIHMLGACQGCGLIDSTLKDGIELIMMDEVPGVIEVRNI
ncbi:MAG: NifU family protein [Erysipelotrichaceae bacterium]|nr:NifU family protein [Erysipelotrichaceae bacterium]